jgi:hypothetical protein
MSKTDLCVCYECNDEWADLQQIYTDEHISRDIFMLCIRVCNAVLYC